MDNAFDMVPSIDKALRDVMNNSLSELEAALNCDVFTYFGPIADGLENRTIVSGIAQHYEPEQLVGKQVCFVANFPPRKFKDGLVSEGMILSAVNADGTLSVMTTDREVLPGSKVQ